MQSKMKYLNENTIGILVIIGTLVLYHMLNMESDILQEFRRSISVVWVFMIPGIASSLIYAVLTKNIRKAIVVGVLTNILWFIWAIAYMLATFELN